MLTINANKKDIKETEDKKMQIRNRIIYPSLLVLFMGLHFSSNVYADCGAPSCSGMPEHSMPSSDIPITIPDAVTPRPPEFPITERLNLADGILEGRLTRLKQLDRQILTTAYFLNKIPATTRELTTLHDMAGSLLDLITERKDINAAFVGRFNLIQEGIDERLGGNASTAVDQQWLAYNGNAGVQSVEAYLSQSVFDEISSLGENYYAVSGFSDNYVRLDNDAINTIRDQLPPL